MMNERLKELYRQAHMVREYPLDDPMRGGNPPTVYWGGERSAERFAEQIINECIEVVNSHRSKMDSGPTYIIQSIKEYFKVI